MIQHFQSLTIPYHPMYGTYIYLHLFDFYGIDMDKCRKLSICHRFILPRNSWSSGIISLNLLLLNLTSSLGGHFSHRVDGPWRTSQTAWYVSFTSEERHQTNAIEQGSERHSLLKKACPKKSKKPLILPDLLNTQLQEVGRISSWIVTQRC